MQAEIQQAAGATSLTQESALESALDPGRVLQYLSQNPDFFNQHEEILTSLKIPHRAGSAVSLVEKQISVLRRQCSSLEGKRNDTSTETVSR